MGSIIKFINIIENNKLIKLLILHVISEILCSIINLLLTKNLFKLEITNKQKIQIFVFGITGRLIIDMLIPSPYYRGINVIFMLFLTKVILKINIEKNMLSNILNSISYVSTDIVISKILCKISSQIDYQAGLSDYKYEFFLTLLILIIQFIIYVIIKNKNITIDLSNKLSKQTRKRIIIISCIGFLVISLNAIELIYFKNGFPYSILIINIIILMLYFYLSMKDIIAIKEIEQKDLKIEGLENYNKTLETMYDDIRAFRHDYGNFIQALNGYVQTNNIEGIKSMTESVLKECTKVNNMGILDPKIINHSAVYAILTNKYYIAQENNISMNIEVSTDIKEMKICDYEFCKILGILLDNAIEAAMECNEKVVNVKFIKDSKASRNLVIIENTYSKVDIDIDRIFDKDYTTKTNNEQNHGLGLYTIRKILNKNNNLNLFTKKSNLFSQQLEIYEK